MNYNTSINNLLYELKHRYGIRQTTVAAAIGVSRQVLTDIKSGRRRFHRTMALKLRTHFTAEPWADWLGACLDSLFEPANNAAAVPAEPLPTPPTPDESTPEPFPARTPRKTDARSLPVLDAPWRGNPAESPNHAGRRIALPDALDAHIAGAVNPYALVINFDSRDGRLRRGDLALVVQDPDREGEITLIEHRGALRLAKRYGRHPRPLRRESGVSDAAWITLDSGTIIPEDQAERAGGLVGIVLALL